MYDDEHEEDFGESHPYDEQAVRTCERCMADANDKSRPHPMCVEVQLAFGLVTWICHDCRKDWYRIFKSHELQREYSAATMRLEFWKMRIGPDTPESDAEKGIKLLCIVEDLELKINEVANRWLIEGLDEVRTL